MDSGKSGSLQSSSGDDDEYDSRAADSFSGLMFLPPPPLQQQQPPPPPSLRPPTPPAPLFDPLSNYLQLQNSNPNNILIWPRNTNINLGSEIPFNNNSAFTPTFQPPTGDTNPSLAPPSLTPNQSLAARNPKKRSRASRRAPTTVLTTDATNFRAMVQEFTGIPAPPFSNSSSNSPFQRSRLDLFSTFPHLHRPFSQLQSPPFISSTQASTSSNNILNTTNPNNITSFLQTNHKFPFSSSSNFASKIQDSLQLPDNENSNIRIRGFNDFSSPHGNVVVGASLSNLPSLTSSDQIHNNDNNITNTSGSSWRNINVEINHDDQQPAAAMRLMNRFEEENSGTRSSEGMVESWISSSQLK